VTTAPARSAAACRPTCICVIQAYSRCPFAREMRPRELDRRRGTSVIGTSVQGAPPIDAADSASLIRTPQPCSVSMLSRSHRAHTAHSLRVTSVAILSSRLCLEQSRAEYMVVLRCEASRIPARTAVVRPQLESSRVFRTSFAPLKQCNAPRAISADSEESANGTA
jgi:hypothetical protein